MGLLSALLALRPSFATQWDGKESIANLVARAEDFEARGQWEDAARIYQEILKDYPHSVATLNRLGALEVRQGKLADGIGHYQRALRVNPNEFGTLLNLGIAYMKVPDFKVAAQWLERTVTIQPAHFQAQILLGVSLVGDNQSERAIPHVEKPPT